MTTDLPAGPAAVVGDFEALRRVIRGLIDNAIKYTPAGGRITISARPGDETVSISVKDTGKGIVEADLPHVFEKFYRGVPEADGVASHMFTAAPGVGLGLYLAQHIVGQLDGEITVESTPGVGTTFSVRLPRWIEDTVAEENKESADAEACVGS